MGPWLEGAVHIFMVLTDHRKEYLQKAKRLNPRQACWAMFFTRFDFKVTYLPGKNTKKDALSRQHDPPKAEDTTTLILAPTYFAAPIIWSLDESMAMMAT